MAVGWTCGPGYHQALPARTVVEIELCLPQGLISGELSSLPGNGLLVGFCSSGFGRCGFPYTTLSRGAVCDQLSAKASWVRRVIYLTGVPGWCAVVFFLWPRHGMRHRHCRVSGATGLPFPGWSRFRTGRNVNCGTSIPHFCQRLGKLVSRGELWNELS